LGYHPARSRHRNVFSSVEVDVRRLGLSILALIVLAATGWGGYEFGLNKGAAGGRALSESRSLDALANSLLALRFIEANELGEAKRLLQAQTNGQLSWLIEFDGSIVDPEFAKQRCKVLTTLKQYREKRGLFQGAEWEYLWKMPGMKEEEARRIEFLKNTACGPDTFFTIQ